jgi:hypothetical protein
MHDACRSVSLMHRDVPAPDKSIRSHLDVIQVVVLFLSGTRPAVLALNCFRRDTKRADVRHKGVWRLARAEYSAVDAHVNWDQWGRSLRLGRVLKETLGLGMAGQMEVHRELVRGRDVPRLAVYMRKENAGLERGLGVGKLDRVATIEGAMHWFHHVKADD